MPLHHSLPPAKQTAIGLFTIEVEAWAVIWHWPLLQRNSPVQAWSHEPQLLLSVFWSTQAPLHHNLPSTAQTTLGLIAVAPKGGLAILHWPL